MHANQISTTAISVFTGWRNWLLKHNGANAKKFNHLLHPKEAQAAQSILNQIHQLPGKKSPGQKLLSICEYFPYRVTSFVYRLLGLKAYDAIISARKLMIRHRIKQAADIEGVEQIVILAGGIDPLAYFSALLYPNVQFFELDLPAMSQAKKSIINTTQGKTVESMPPNLTLVEGDITKYFVETLNTAGYDPKKKTLMIAEGLTMYLSAPHNNFLLAQANTLLKHHESELLISAKPKNEPSFLERYLLKKSDESYLFNLSAASARQYYIDRNLAIKARYHMPAAIEFTSDPDLQYYYENMLPNETKEPYYLLKPNTDCYDNNRVPSIDEIQSIFKIPPNVKQTPFTGAHPNYLPGNYQAHRSPQTVPLTTDDSLINSNQNNSNMRKSRRSLSLSDQG